MALVEVQALEFGYREKKVLDIPTFSIAAREKLFLYGPSGCGKSTLLSLLTGVLAPWRGNIKILGRDLTEFSSAQRDSFRGSHIGYIFQSFNLIPFLTVRENILLPLELNPERKARVRKNLEDELHALCEGLGIEPLLNQKAAELSVGQSQRVAAARSLIGNPELIIADEPTSSLDFDHREKFLKILFQQCEAHSSTLLFVSHDRSLASLFSRTLSLPEINGVKS